MVETYAHRDSCLACGSESLSLIMDYGPMPLAGGFLLPEDLDKDKSYPLSLVMCEDCSLLQTDSSISPEVLFKDYRYLSSVSLSQYFENYASWMVDYFGLGKDNKVLEIGCNDGVLLAPLGEMGVDCQGIDPADNVTQRAIDKGCTVTQGFFSYTAAKDHYSAGMFDVVTCSNCFAHMEGLQGVMAGINWVLKPGGSLVVEVHYAKHMVDTGQFDTVYHEHLAYWSVSSLSKFAKLYGYCISDVTETDMHGGTIRVVLTRGVYDSHTAQRLIDDEVNIGLTDSLVVKNAFGKRATENIADMKSMLSKMIGSGNKIVGYGAAGRAVIAMNLYGITTKDIEYIVDESPERQGRFVPGAHIPIVGPEALDENLHPPGTSPQYVVIFAWNYARTIMDKCRKGGYNGGFIVPLPSVGFMSDTGLFISQCKHA